MKNIKLFALLPLLAVTCLNGCNKNNNQPNSNERPYKENFVYVEEPIYEPINIEKPGAEIDHIEFVGFPYNHEIKVAAFDDTDASIRAWYKDNTTNIVPFKMKNIPLEFRHYFGEIGEHSIELIFNNHRDKFDFTIVDNPAFPGYYCYFYDMNKKFLDMQIVGYYQTAVYQGPELPEVQEDENFRYTLKGWDHKTTNIHQNMQFVANYDRLEKRYNAVRPYNHDYIGLTGLVSKDRKTGSALFYLGRVRRAAALYGPTMMLDGEDITLPIALDDFGPYWSELNLNIVKYVVDYEVDPAYNSLRYGEIAQIVTSPTFVSHFNPSYGYYGVEALLDDMSDVSLSSKDPFDFTLTKVKERLSYVRPTISKDAKYGYYRAAIVGSFDIYLDVSFKRIAKDKYEMGAINQFVCAPVDDTFSLDAQYSEDEEFGPNFDTKLILSTRTLYNIARMIDWGTWSE